MKKNALRTIIQILIPSLIGGAILYFLYRKVDFNEVRTILQFDIKYEWLMLAILIGTAGQYIRAYLWDILLRPNQIKLPIHYITKTIFINNGANLILPRAGDFVRCAIVSQRTKVPFSTLLGTLFNERIVDIIVLLITLIPALFMSGGFFLKVYRENPTSFAFLINLLTNGWIWGGGLLLLLITVFSVYRMRKHSTIRRFIQAGHQTLKGITSIRHMQHPLRFCLLGLSTWGCYFCQLYFNLLAFTYTADISFNGAFITFVMGSLAGIIPIQGGIGPWHFAVITALMFYGYGNNEAAAFALITHTIQMLTFALLGIVGAIQIKLPLFSPHNNHA